LSHSSLALARHLGLAYAALDIVQTPDDRYVFLEINPAGRYGWIEVATGLPISDALTGLLSMRASGSLVEPGRVLLLDHHPAGHPPRHLISVADLANAIETYIDGWNERATPFT
jgi:hypothetical protein